MGEINDRINDEVHIVKTVIHAEPGVKRAGNVWPMSVMCWICMMTLCIILKTAFSISANMWIIAAVFVLYCGFYTFFFSSKKIKNFRFPVFLGCVFAWSFLILIVQDIFRKNLYYIFNCFAGQLNRTYQSGISLKLDAGTSATFFLSFCFFWVAWLLAEAIIDRADSGLFMFVTFPIVIGSLLCGGKIAMGAYFVLFLCLLCSIAGSSIRVRKRFWGGEGSKDYEKNRETGRRAVNMMSLVCAGIGAVIIVLSFAVLRPALSTPIGFVSDVTEPVKTSGLQFLYRFLPKISGGRLKLSLEGVGGGVSDGKLGDVEGTAYDNVESLRVTVSRQPSEILYLKGYIGADYEKNSWQMSDESALMDAALNWKTDGNSLLYIQNMPFLRMMYVQSQNGTDGGADPIQISVERLDANTSYTYVPYQTYLNDYYGIFGGDGAIEGQTAQDDTYEYFENKPYIETMQQWNNVSNSDDTSAGNNMLDELEASYESYADNHYTEVPEDLSSVKKLCSKKSEEWDKKFEGNLSDEQKQDLTLEKIDDVKNFVVRTLWENCEFSKSATKISADDDFIEHFLSDTKKGDSTAFASAAVMMFRECGIPARYVVGYAAPANLFTSQSDGSYMAVLQDDNAHAWAEIYMPGCGWTPVETTPGFAGTVSNLEMPADDTEDNAVSETEENDNNKSDNTADDSTDIHRAQMLKIIAAVIGAIVAIGVCIALRVFWQYRKKCALKKGMSPNERIKTIFCSFYELLMIAHFSDEADTTQPEFVHAVIKAYPQLNEDDMTAFMKLVLKANYGADELTAEQAEAALAMYKKLIEIMPRKVVFRQYI